MSRELFFFSVFLFSFLLTGSLSVADATTFSFKCGGVFNLCGYVDRKSGQTLIPFKFEEASPFAGGLAAVKSHGKWGYIDSTGSMVIKPRFELAGAFTSGHAEVVLDNQAGVIDRNGKLVVETQFARAIPLTEDIVLIAEGQRHPEESWRLAPFESLSDIIFKRRFGLYRINRGWLSEKRYKINFFDRPSQGLFWASEAEGKDPLFGLLRADGTWQVTPRYTKVHRVIGNFATVQGFSDDAEETSSQTRKKMSGAVDKNGRLVIPLKYEGLSYWMGGYGLARKFGDNPKLGLVTPKGELLTGRYYENVERSTDRRLPRVLKNGRWYSVTSEGKLLEDQRNGHVHLSCPDGLQIIEINGFFSVVHPKLPRLIRSKRSAKNLLLTSDHCRNPYLVWADKGRYKFVTQDGKILPATGWYDNVFQFQSGRAVVSFEGKWGIISETGLFLVPPVYDKLSPHLGNSHWYTATSPTERLLNVFKAELNGRHFWIDSQNNEISKPSGPTGEEGEAILRCGGILKRFEEDGLWGMKDREDNVFIEPKYRALTCYERGIAWGALANQKLWCPIGIDGKRTSFPACKKFENVARVIDTRPEELSKDTFESGVLWLRGLLDYAQGNRAEPPRLVGMTF
ncbi:WG repeat-containing protein [Roseibium aggregatum]|uniref:WG repeat-containing protein n=1 Tax=Roseibium aggregatum TaxID=187304 RepID=A0A939J467_9HYPH|nr:WG repeat-containing protein [Roseibium aggregatum]MBN9670875.1 WG repeat-containing protein [Roseibium aggregatum]